MQHILQRTEMVVKCSDYLIGMVVEGQQRVERDAKYLHSLRHRDGKPGQHKWPTVERSAQTCLSTEECSMIAASDVSELRQEISVPKTRTRAPRYSSIHTLNSIPVLTKERGTAAHRRHSCVIRMTQKIGDAFAVNKIGPDTDLR